MNNVLICLDGSIYAKSVCRHAAWIAARLGAQAELLHAIDLGTEARVTPDLSGSLAIEDADRLLEETIELEHARGRIAQRRGRLLLEQARSLMEEAGITVAGARLRNGNLVDVLHEAEDRARLVVLGKRGEGHDAASVHLGSNLERVVRASKRPCLVASRAFKPVRRVLVAHDGGESAGRAIAFVASSGAFAGLELLVLTVGERDGRNEAAQTQAREVLLAAGIGAAFEIRDGEPDATIARAVAQDGYDLLVMGAYGHSRIRNLIIGSTTTAMIRDCRIPVLLFR